MLGSGTAGDPYIIQDVNDLQAMKDALAAYYELGQNIDASATVGWNGGAGFIPVGSLASPFTGSFDAEHYTISDLFISRGLTDEVGLFGATDGATIQKARLVNCNITGDDSVGALIGDARDGTITDCQSSGVVNGGDSYIGGLIGWMSGCTASELSSSCTVNGNTFVGGLIGWAYQNTISQVYATGNVTGTDDDVGGLIGVSQKNDIDDCYARGAVVGDEYVGGLIGYSYDATETVDNCYSTGSVTGNNHVGGLMGFSSSVVSNCFWNTETSGQATSAAGTGKTTAQMKQKATFSGWDIAYSSTYRNNGYPFLAWEIGSSSTWLIYGLVGNGDGNGNGDGEPEPEPTPPPRVVKPSVMTLPATGVSQ